MVTAALAESNGSLPSGLWLTSPAGWLPRTGISSGTLRSVIEYGLPLPFYPSVSTREAKKCNSISAKLKLIKIKPPGVVIVKYCSSHSTAWYAVTLKMHTWKWRTKTTGSGKCRTGKWRINLRALAFPCSVCWRCGRYAKWLSAVSLTYWHGYACVFLMCIWRTIVRHFSN